MAPRAQEKMGRQQESGAATSAIKPFKRRATRLNVPKWGSQDRAQPGGP